jgi:superfamily I DNA/RNA helicase
VLLVAYQFAREYIAPEEAEDDGVPMVQPLSAGRRGEAPVLSEHRSLQAEIQYLGTEFKRFNDQGRPWREMAVLYRAGFIGDEIVRGLRASNVPVDCVEQGSGKRGFNPGHDSVKVMTMHKSKGLEFPIVGIAGLGYMPYKGEDLKGEAKLLYVGMTRAMDTLLMTHHRETEFVTRIRHATVAAHA